MKIRDACTWLFARFKSLPRKTVVLCILCICFVVTLYTKKDVSIGIEKRLLTLIYGVVEQNETATVFGQRILNRTTSASENRSVLNFGEVKSAAEINYTSLWNNLDAMIGNRELYSANFDVTIATNALRYAKLMTVDLFLIRSSYKWIITLEGGQTVLFKPAVVNNTERQELCVKGCEHPEYEVAGFTVNRCFKDGMIPGAMIHFLRRNVSDRSEPGRVYHHYYPTVEYEKPRPYMLKLPGDDSYCKEFRQMEPYRGPRDFGDILDITVISYITSHGDQKLTVIQIGSSYMHVMFDYGLSFCSHYHILLAAPIYQCCSIRRRSFMRLEVLKDTLPSEFEKMTKDDPLYPLLQPSQIQLMIKRIKMLLALIEYCINLKGFDNVVEEFV